MLRYFSDAAAQDVSHVKSKKYTEPVNVFSGAAEGRPLCGVIPNLRNPGEVSAQWDQKMH